MRVRSRAENRGCLPRPDGVNRPTGQQKEDGACAVDGLRTRDVDDAAERRPGDDRRLARGSVRGNGAREQRNRNERGEQCLHRRHLERARDTDHEDQREDRMRGQRRVRTADAQAECRERLDEHACLQHAAPIEVIGDVTCDEHEEERGNELRKADEPEIERASGQRVDLPADADGEHLVREHREYAREPEQDEWAFRAQQLAAIRHRIAA